MISTKENPETVIAAFFEHLRAVFSSYLVRMDCGGLEPRHRYLPFDFDDEIDRRVWGRMLGETMVKDELRELTNILNDWQGALYRWHAWNDVLRDYKEEDAWELRREFLDALAHQCLLYPSAARDALTFVTTNFIHQVRLTTDKDYPDFLEGDPKAPDEKPRHLSRRQKEKRLSDLIANFPRATEFLVLLRQIDDRPYRESTYDYRNRFSHAIGPRLGFGETRTVVRSVIQHEKMTKQPDGTFALVPQPGRLAVCYEFGGTPALDMEEARIANLAQYIRARACYELSRALLSAGMTAMKLK